jgi:hypothetical protein
MNDDWEIIATYVFTSEQRTKGFKTKIVELVPNS